ncbi:MAG: LuxR C-terminal-related transcriptional regulator [Desulfarculus sp.]|nr:LuxR C-terminal-related transcriptional regulator [Pseudomonadota bacterium]MBU4598013.1 LuxR C-terminal-related transcriptional regulator [Pseudomonadota bacterium]MBV1714328.1 LuxR C-terminal-related transcriptional regulator [Desulfarculus sp.]MBV1740061.1 LuxR C-terminal-related transcriptional regulator [Desulfarculus sp.]
MNKPKTSSVKFEQLRITAEELLRDKGPASSQVNGHDLAQLVHELEVHQAELEIQNEELRLTQTKLEATRDQYFDLYDQAPVGYLTIDEKGIIRRANLTIASMLSLPRAHLVGQSFYLFVSREHHGTLLQHLKSGAKPGTKQNIETKLLKKDGTEFHAQMESSPLGFEGGALGLRIVLVDISRLKAAESELRRANERLEEEVRIRTSELIETNQALREEIKQREQMVWELSQHKTELESKKTELELKAKELEQSSIAVGVLLHRSEENRESMESNILQQVDKLLLPFLTNVLTTSLEPVQRQGIEAAIYHLEQITSSFAQKLSAPNLGLTTREIQVASLINRGQSSKEIAETLNLSPDTVSFHRRNIRQKLGITDTDTSLAKRLREFA